jgi:hypothetical protein
MQQLTWSRTAAAHGNCLRWQPHNGHQGWILLMMAGKFHARKRRPTGRRRSTRGWSVLWRHRASQRPFRAINAIREAREAPTALCMVHAPLCRLPCLSAACCSSSRTLLLQGTEVALGLRFWLEMWMLCSTPALDLFSRALRKKKRKVPCGLLRCCLAASPCFCVCVLTMALQRSLSMLRRQHGSEGAIFRVPSGSIIHASLYADHARCRTTGDQACMSYDPIDLYACQSANYTAKRWKQTHTLFLFLSDYVGLSNSPRLTDPAETKRRKLWAER